jgi:FKBP-type peptidyl-prolyl cis-trans isomerase SlyD
MTISEEKVVSLSYNLEVDSETIETRDAASPLKFVFGSGQLLPVFEANIKGKSAGDKFEFTLKPEQAYGAVNNAAIIELPISTFIVNGELKEDILFEGNVIPMMDNNGNPLNGKVLNIGKETVKLDFNHPLAGKTLNFAGEVTEVRPATEDEIDSGYPEGMEPQGGCCSGGSCGSGGCDDHDKGGCGSDSCGCN